MVTECGTCHYFSRGRMTKIHLEIHLMFIKYTKGTFKIDQIY